MQEILTNFIMFNC